MWRLKIAEEGSKDEYLYSTNNYVGRQIWEYDPEDPTTPEEIAQVEDARQNFYRNRYQVRPSGDLLWRYQFLREKNVKQKIPQVKIEGGEEITHEKATRALRRGVHFFSALQASDGHWPAEIVVWGACFTYGAWFGLGGLAAAGKTYDNCAAMRRGVDFLRIQRDDGGWGESYRSCPEE
ncbi:hypothetical protein Tsubulata_044832, partial [Turnera subulata]